MIMASTLVGSLHQLHPHPHSRGGRGPKYRNLKVTGLLNATFGNAVEMIVAIQSLGACDSVGEGCDVGTLGLRW